MTNPLPFCETCKVNRVKRRYRTSKVRTRFCSQACVPLSLRVDAARKGGLKSIYRYRAGLFRADVARFTDGNRLTREDLLELLTMIYRRGYESGYKAKQRHSVKVAA